MGRSDMETALTETTDVIRRRNVAHASKDEAHLIALDIDGTLTTSGSLEVSAETAAAVRASRMAGHHVVLASGRSLAGVMPIVRALGITNGWAVASNGAVIAFLNPGSDGYELDVSTDVQILDARLVITTALNARLSGLQIAVEEIGVGYYVDTVFPTGLLRGQQMLLPVHELQALASPRIVLRAPGVHTLIDPLRAVGLTATPADVDWIDVTGPNLSKAVALETVRRRLGVPAERTVAVGDSVNDIEALTWAARGVAMGGAPDHVRAVADEITGTLHEHGAAAVLRSIAVAR
ncbi:HAD family hydrolase [Promicromonospora alba]|uniref:HAD family hydrolase n=1 Tax=Promicromonospora alba TaxID=1616110 RepID=A0ABV9HJS3_9MICO